MSQFQEQLIHSMQMQLEQLQRRLTHVEAQHDHIFTPSFIGLTDGSGLSALSGPTPGFGFVTLYDLVPVDPNYGVGLGAILSASTDHNGTPVVVEAYNLSTTAVAAATWVFLTQEAATGQYVCLFEDC